MNEEDIQKIYDYKKKERLKYKRCKWCKFLKFWKKETYVFGAPTKIYYCMYTNKVLRTDNSFWDVKGCFCKMYEPAEVIV